VPASARTGVAISGGGSGMAVAPTRPVLPVLQGQPCCQVGDAGAAQGEPGTTGTACARDGNIVVHPRSQPHLKVSDPRPLFVKDAL
jgi:hypothetical protein